MKKKNVLAALLAATFSATMLFGCGDASDPVQESSSETSVETDTEISNEDLQPTVYIDAADFEKMYTDAEPYTGMGIQFTGQVFSVDESDDGIFMQVYEDPENYNHNTIVGYMGKDIEVKEDDYIIVDGVISGVFEGENMMGGVVTAPAIYANSLVISDYMTVMSPALKTYSDCGSITQHDVTITINKVEIAEAETRLYVTVKNESGDEFKVREYRSNAVQDGKQYEQQSNYDGDYEELNDSLRSGAESTGIITLEALNTESGFTLYLEGSSDNYDLDFEPFEFKIEAK